MITADPDFDLTSEARAEKSKTTTAARKSEAYSKIRSRSLEGFRFGPIPGTRIEAQVISKELDGIYGEKARAYVRVDALEEVLKGIKAPKILHIAAHGFFLGDEGRSIPKIKALYHDQERGAPAGEE